jgi:transglutaminase-like putative cysteine protease
MRVHIRYETIHHFEPSARSIIQMLHLMPRSHEGQHVADWRIDIDVDCRLNSGEDAFGNILHSFSANGPIANVAISIEGEAETFDTAGILSHTAERFPPELFLRETPLTIATDDLRKYADTIAMGHTEPLAKLHALLETMDEEFAVKPDVQAATTVPTAAKIFEQRSGSSRGLAHIFIALARHLKIPARFVSGFYVPEDNDKPLEFLHSWTEAYVEGFGWIGFDPSLARCPQERHIRVACGLDYYDCAPARTAHSGSSTATSKTTLRISPRGGQSQSQSQS